MLNSVKEITKPNYTDKKVLEKYSSLFTLSDMEIFIFPELYYPLVLANIMSPIIWEWRKDSWFKDLEKIALKNKIISNNLFFITSLSHCFVAPSKSFCLIFFWRFPVLYFSLCS